MLKVIAQKIEEAEHPYYVVSYTVEYNGKEVMSSIARYVKTNNNSKVQFLEPDIKKMLKMGIDKELNRPLQEIIDQAVREKAESYMEENQA